jgi:phosphoribosyl-ATP pyrophosphohydrolase/phosphoribosyl-AMP cyclohydrolase
VKYHVSNMLAKPELSDRHELAKWKPSRSRLPGRLSIKGALIGLAGFAGIAVAVVGLVAARERCPAHQALKATCPTSASTLERPRHIRAAGKLHVLERHPAFGCRPGADAAIFECDGKIFLALMHYYLSSYFGVPSGMCRYVRSFIQLYIHLYNIVSVNHTRFHPRRHGGRAALHLIRGAPRVHPGGPAMPENVTLTFDANGLVPAVVQDAESGEVLVLAWMNRESIAQTYATGHVTFWSRNRNELWEKGATSGNYLDLVSIAKNCEANSLLVKARPNGPTCHTGHQSCYYRDFEPEKDLG